jgi:hypothetical protein
MRKLSHKQYELTNHLGNVLSTVLDRKIPITSSGGSGGSGGSTTITHYEGDVVFASDYYPFGSPMSWTTSDSSGGRLYSGGGYRYGFNGQEKDDEIAGAGSINTAEFWQYDTRLCRRWNVDPVVKPDRSSYSCFANNPIFHTDVKGDHEGDYYSKLTDKYLGSDGVDDNKIYTVEGDGASNSDTKFSSELEKHRASNISSPKPYNYNGKDYNVSHVMTWYTSNTDLLKSQPNSNIMTWSDPVDPNFNSGYGPVSDRAKCLHLAQRTQVSCGFSTGLYHSGTPLYNKNGVLQKSTFIEQIALINQNLKNGIPTIVGVDDNNRFEGKNPSNGTDHFINIVGGGKDKTGYFFTYYENAVPLDKDTRNITMNKLYLTNLHKVSGGGVWGLTDGNALDRNNQVKFNNITHVYSAGKK